MQYFALARYGFSRTGECLAADRERRQIEIRAATYCEVAKQFTRQAAEFKPMPAARAGDDDPGMIGVKVDDKILIGCIGVHTYL